MQPAHAPVHPSVPPSACPSVCLSALRVCHIVVAVAVAVGANSLKFLHTFPLKWRKIMFFMIICVYSYVCVMRRRGGKGYERVWVSGTLYECLLFEISILPSCKCCLAYKQYLHSQIRLLPQTDSPTGFQPNALSVCVCVCNTNNTNTMHWANWRRGRIFW